MDGMCLKLPAMAFALFAIAAPRMSDAQNANACARTPASGALLGKPFPESDRWYGSEALAVLLPPESIWRGMGPAYRYRDKLFWWSTGFKAGAESKLKVTGRRLDGSSPPADISKPTNAYASSLGGWAMLVAVEFPRSGCWEIAGKYLGQKLTFVVEVP